jgi:flavin reductase (DIM6/NTAB) family NADH-FMN oxidoreductase RutF
MTEPTRPGPSPLGLALGRVPSGLFILTARHDGRSTGMLASWVQQAGFDPPAITVALRLDRYVGDWVRSSGRFTLNQVPAGQKSLLRHFARGFEPDASAFDGLAIAREAAGGPVLADALAYLDAEVLDEMAGPDHRILLARVVAGDLLDPAGEPMLHVRHNGFHY